MSEWKERESFVGRWRVADGASRLGLAHTHTHTYTHRKRRGEGILQCIVKTSVVFCSADVSLLSGAKVLTQFCPSPFWIFLRCNGDEGLCGLASGQQAPGWNTSLTSLAMFFFSLFSELL